MISPKLKAEGLTAEKAELQALLSSKAFARAPLLSRMLAYICEQSFQGNSDELKEYSIGAIALGRGDDFDPEKDSIVRVMATRLRKRLVEYYAGEGARHQLKIYLPEVGYAPLFAADPQIERLTAPGPVTVPAAPAAIPASKRLFSYAAVGVVCALVSGIVVWSVSRPGYEAGLPSMGPDIRSIWSEVLKPDQPTDVVLADSALGLIRELAEKPVSLNDYISRQYLRRPDLAAADPERDEVAIALSRRLTSMADVQISNNVLVLARGTRARVSVVFARDYSVAQMQSDNVILAGSANTNPWVSTFDHVLNFRLEPGGTVRNLSPRAGEQPTYTAAGGDSQGYSVAAFLPKNGGSRSVLIAAGTGAQATLAAAYFLSSEDALRAFCAKLPSRSSARFSHFEVLLRTNRWSGGFEPVAFRAIP